MLVRRSILVVLLFALPPVLTWGMYHASIYVLYATHRMIDPRVLWYAGTAEFLVFFFIAFLEVKDRW